MTQNVALSESSSSTKVLFCRETLWDQPSRLSTNYFAQEFASAGWDVFWLTRPLSLLSLVSKRWASVNRQKLRLWLKGGATVDDNVRAYAGLTLLPYKRTRALGSRWSAEHSLKFTAPPLKSVLRRHGFESPDLLWLSDISQASIVDISRPKRMVLHVTDDYTQFPGAPRSVAEVEKWLAERAHLVIVTHPLLAKKFGEMGVKVRYLPHGVVPEPYLRDHPMPEEFEPLTPPRIVYVGALADWVDWDMLEAATERCPDFSFVFIGPWSAKSRRSLGRWESLRSRGNVHWLGEKAANEIPRYLHHGDAAIMPFQKSALKSASNPMKLYEYVSSGLPVVSTWPAWEAIGLDTEVPLRAVTTAPEFADAIAELARRTPAERDRDKQAGRRFARANSWKSRFEEALAFVNQS